MLKTLRERRGLTQQDLAKRAKLTQAYIALLESGEKKNPSLLTLRRLAKALGVSEATMDTNQVVAADLPPGRAVGMMDSTIPQMWRRQQEERWRAAVNAMTLMNRTPPPPPYYSDLLALADLLVAEGRHEMAVVVAQMACEVVVEQTLTPLLKGKKPPQNFNVHAVDVRKVYERLTRDTIGKQAFWRSYERHVVRRHNVVHRGGRVGLAEAQESTAAARQFVDHVDQVRRNIL